MQERLKSKSEGKTRVLAYETKGAIKEKVEGIEKLTGEDFDGLLIMMKSLAFSLYLKSLQMFINAQHVVAITVVSLNFAAIVVLSSLRRFREDSDLV